MFVTTPCLFHIRGSKSYHPNHHFFSSLEFHSDFNTVYLKTHQAKLIIAYDDLDVLVLSILVH